MIFFTKIKFFPKLLEYLTIQVVHSKDLAKGYTLIPMSILIDIYLGAKLSNLSSFHEILEILVIFGNKIPDMCKVTTALKKNTRL